MSAKALERLRRAAADWIASSGVVTGSFEVLPGVRLEVRHARKPTKRDQNISALPFPPGATCSYCGVELDQENRQALNGATWDHIVSLADGGSNAPANLQPACRSCNCSKRDRGTEYIAARAELSRKRSEAGRRGGQRSAATRLEAAGSNQPKPPPSNTRSKPARGLEANVEANPRQTTPPSSPPLHSPSSPTPEKPKDNNNFQGLVRSPAGAVVVVVGEKTELQKPASKTPPIARLPRSLSEALELPLMERAQMLWKVRDAAFDAEAFNAHAWPELQELARAFREASGLAHVQAGPWPNAATKRLVELLAVPHLPSTIREAFRALKTSSWWSTPERRRLGLAGISPRVLEGLLTEAAGGGTKRLSPEELDRLFAMEATHATA